MSQLTVFRGSEIVTADHMQALTDLRVNKPERVFEIAKERSRRPQLTTDGKLNIIACDHPARRVTAIGDFPFAMADRQDYLGRMVRVLANDACDGIMATMDILEELLLLQEITGQRFLDNKLMVGSINRGGLDKSLWEMDDPGTGITPETCAEWNLDGAKLLLRLCDDDQYSLKTVQMCADMITRLNAQKLPTFLEPLPVENTPAGFRVIKKAEDLCKITGVASALGDSSRYLWLKLPFCEQFEHVAKSTTLPILLLGGDATGEPSETVDTIRQAMRAGHNVRGVMLGRNALYPGAADPLDVAREIHAVIHG